ncbi:hypothetical protein VPH35_114270 [Triticum aestivum]
MCRGGLSPQKLSLGKSGRRIHFHSHFPQRSHAPRPPAGHGGDADAPVSPADPPPGHPLTHPPPRRRRSPHLQPGHRPRVPHQERRPRRPHPCHHRHRPRGRRRSGLPRPRRRLRRRGPLRRRRRAGGGLLPPLGGRRGPRAPPHRRQLHLRPRGPAPRHGRVLRALVRPLPRARAPLRRRRLRPRRAGRRRGAGQGGRHRGPRPGAGARRAGLSHPPLLHRRRAQGLRRREDQVSSLPPPRSPIPCSSCCIIRCDLLCCRDAIVAWISKKLGPAVQNLTTADEAEKIVTGDDVAVLAYLDHLSGAHSDELAAASRLEDTISFYQTTSPDVAKLFHIDPEAKRPSVVLLKKEEEKLTVFDGEFRASAIAEFVSANKIPLITTLTQETAPAIFDNPIKKQILLFAVAKESPQFLPIIKETAKSFKGKLLFVFVERDNEEVGEPVANYFGIAGQETTVLAYTGNEDAKKFFFSGEISLDTIKEFAQDFLEDKLTPSYKSDPVPESNDEDVKVVVGKSLDQIVLDESKDVLLEVYAPWCGHCQSLEPIYNKLAKYLRGIDSLVIAKMDGTNNEHPRAKPDGFPTILFYPAGKKSFEPITFEGDRTVVEMYKFLKKHAAIPFKLKRPDSSAARTDGADGSGSTTEGEKSSGSNPKDEL